MALSQPLVVSVSGSQHGTSAEQHRVLEHVLRLLYRDGAVLRHGDCVGVDEEAHDLARRCGYWIIKHPPEDKRKCAHTFADQVMPDRPYLERDDDIADACHVLVACPAEKDELIRSGTWTTIRYARRHYKYIIIIRPDGTIVMEP